MLNLRRYSDVGSGNSYILYAIEVSVNSGAWFSRKALLERAQTGFPTVRAQADTVGKRSDHECKTARARPWDLALQNRRHANVRNPVPSSSKEDGSGVFVSPPGPLFNEFKA